VLSYAHVLSLMAGSEGVDGNDARNRRGHSEEAAVPLAEVIKKCRAIAGHSRLHVMTLLKRMEKLNLISMEASRSEALSGNAARHSTDPASRQLVTFDPVRITERAQQVADEDLELSINSELELIELTDLEALIGVEKKLILNKLSHGEIAEDIFAFRKTKVLNYVEQKGVTYFSKRSARTASEFKSLDDLQFLDQRTLFEVVSTTDTYDLAKLLAGTPDQSIADRLLSVMTEARKNEVSWVMRRDLKLDPVELNDIEERFLESVRALKSSATHAAPLSSRESNQH
jgi:hypothetical protein